MSHREGIKWLMNQMSKQLVIFHSFAVSMLSVCKFSYKKYKLCHRISSRIGDWSSLIGTVNHTSGIPQKLDRARRKKRIMKYETR